MMINSRPMKHLMPSVPRRDLVMAALPALLMLAPEAHAYLDPSTGSMILSAIIGVFATIGLALKTYWYKFKRLFSRPKPGAGGGQGSPGDAQSGTPASPDPAPGPGTRAP